MSTEVAERESPFVRYDDCRMLSISRRSAEIDMRKKVTRLLKEWGVIDKPEIKKHRRYLRSHTRIYRFYRNPVSSRFSAPQKLWVVVPTKHDKRLPMETELAPIFDRLSALKKIQDVADEYTFRPTERAYLNTKLMIMKASGRLGAGFPKPRIVPDGEGGLVASWRNSDRQVRLRFQANNDEQDYIYYQSAVDYDIEEPSLENLKRRLEWLSSA